LTGRTGTYIPSIRMTKPSVNPRLFDTRLTMRNLKHGVLSRKELDKQLDALPDVANKSITLGEVEQQRIARGDVDRDD